MLAGKAQIEALIPHAGRMCLLDELLDWNNDEIRCLARSHSAPDNPLRVRGELASVCGIEYAAQAMALHARLTLQAHTPRAGYLASVRDLVCHVACLDQGSDALIVEAHRLMGDAAGAVYGFSLSMAGKLLVEGRAAVMLEA